MAETIEGIRVDGERPPLSVRRSVHVELHYGVLSHLDLGRDAASLFVQRRGRAPAWVAPLLAAYRAAPRRLVAQGLPLYCESVAELRELVARSQLGALGACLLQAMVALEPDIAERERQTCEAHDARAREVDAFLREHLVPLRDGMRDKTDSAPPPLDVFDCRAMTAGDFTHGRAATARGRRRVAVSFAPPIEQVLCQVLHEEVHAVTDPRVREAHTHAPGQDTRAGSSGFALHRALETAAVAAGQNLVDNASPALADAYARWRARYGC